MSAKPLKQDVLDTLAAPSAPEIRRNRPFDALVELAWNRYLDVHACRIHAECMVSTNAAGFFLSAWMPHRCNMYATGDDSGCYDGLMSTQKKSESIGRSSLSCSVETALTWRRLVDSINGGSANRVLANVAAALSKMSARDREAILSGAYASEDADRPTRQEVEQIVADILARRKHGGRQ